MRILLALSILCCSLSAQPHASSRAYTGETGLFFTLDSKTLERGQWAAGFSAANFDQLYPEAPESRPPSNRPFRGFDVDRGEFRLFAAYGIAEDWEVSMALPYIYYNQNIGDVAGFVEGYLRVGEFVDHGLGDLSIATKIRVIDASRLGLALSAAVELPTGQTEGGIASGDTAFRAGGHLDLGTVTLSGIYRFLGERDAHSTGIGAPFDLSDEIHLDAAWRYRNPNWSRTSIITEINAIVFSGGDRAPDDAVYVTGGIRHQWGESCWSTDLAVNYNVTMAASSNPSHPIGGLLSIACTSRNR